MARSWRVEQDGSGEFTTLQPAVDAAASGDTILIGPGFYREMQDIVPQGMVHAIQVAAYNPLDKSLVYIGAGADQVTVGPEIYDDHYTGPCGVFHEGSQEIHLQGIKFVNFYSAFVSYFTAGVVDCVFVGNYGGVVVNGLGSPMDVMVSNCSFLNAQNYGHGVKIWSGGDVVVESCMFDHSQFYFDSTSNASVRNCEFEGYAGSFYTSGGEFTGNVASLTDDGVNVALEVWGNSTVAVTGNSINGGDYCLLIAAAEVTAFSDNMLSGATTATIWCQSTSRLSGSNNHILPSNGQYTVMLYDFPYPNTPAIDLRDNFWGTDDPAQIAEWIWDANDDPEIEVYVEYSPFSGEPMPNEDASWGDLKAMYQGER